MRIASRACFLFLFLSVFSSGAWADEYHDTIEVFQKAGESGTFFSNSYGYAVFPTIGKGGFGIGGAYGTGKVYKGSTYLGDTSMGQLTIGFQLGGQAYSQIIFFRDKRALDQFTSGNFEFGAHASAIAITLSASADATTTGSSATASGAQENATTVGKYYRGMAVFTVAKGGLMYEASIGGQKFGYSPQ